MKQKHVEFPHRTRQEWLQLAEKYFEAETSDEEERQLKLFLCSAEAQDPAFDELKAVMGYLAVGKSRYRQQNEKRSSFQPWKWRSIAAVFFCCLLSGSLYVLRQQERNQCIAYINGQRCTDSGLVLKYVWLILCGLMVVCNGLHAQEKLRSKVLFDGRYNNREGAVEVLVKGKKLAPYHLTLFRSLTLQADSTEIATITALVESDAQKAAEKETGSIGGKLYYGFFCFPGNDKDTNQYLFFRNASLRNPDYPEVIVIYMEGAATLEELKEMFQ